MSAFPRLRAWLDEERDVTLLGLLRVALGALNAWTALKTLQALPVSGYFGDYFHIPLLPEAWLPSARGYAALLVLRALAGVLAMLGLWARPALLTAGSIALYILCCDRLGYHNNRYVLALFTVLLGLSPCDRSFSLRRAARALPRRGPHWVSQLAKVQISLVYLASAGSKLLDPDWRGGQVLHVRYENVLRILDGRGTALPQALRELLAAPWLADVSAKSAITLELFLALGLWRRSTRAAALWLGCWFHFFIEAAAHVELFSFVMWAAYLWFCVPECRERRLYFVSGTGGERIARWLPRWDWLRRFEVLALPRGLSARLGLLGVDRDGRSAEGMAAIALLARGVPLLFPLWPLLHLVTRKLPAQPAPAPRSEPASAEQPPLLAAEARETSVLLGVPCAS